METITKIGNDRRPMTHYIPPSSRTARCLPLTVVSGPNCRPPRPQARLGWNASSNPGEQPPASRSRPSPGRRLVSTWTHTHTSLSFPNKSQTETIC